MIINLLGDSITQGAGASSPETMYAAQLEKILGEQVNNYGIGGTRIAEQRVPTKEWPSFDESFYTRAQRMDKNADVVVVFGGTNDYGHGDAPLGEDGSTDIYTFYGAIDNLYTYLEKTYGKEKIIVIMPLPRWRSDSDRGDGSKPAGSPLFKEYLDITAKKAKQYGFRLLDISEELGEPQIDTTEDKHYVDGLHPNDDGHRIIAECLAKYIKENF